MESLIEHVGWWLCQRPAPSTDRHIHANLTAIISRAGSQRAAARSLGIAESTLRGWLKGAKPKRSPQSIAAAARAWLSLGRYQAARGGSLTIIGVIKVSRDERPRTIHVGRHIPRDVMGRILTRWLRAEPDEKVEASIYRAIARYYTQDLSISRITGVTFKHADQLQWSED